MAAPIIMKVLEKSAFRAKLATPAWQAKMKEMVPSYGYTLNSDAAFANQIHHYNSDGLGLKAVTLDVPAVAAK